jgi:HAD superfamily hydrolase (TIGR01490 family)
MSLVATPAPINDAEASAAPASVAALTIVVLAGDRENDPLSLAFGTKRKALVPAGGVPMILRVLNALDAVPGIAQVIVLANRVEDLASAPELAARRTVAHPPLRFVEGRGSPVTSLRELHDQGMATAPTVVVTADSPLLHAEAISHFIEQALRLHTDMAVAMVAEPRVRAVFPGMARTYFRLKDGAFKSINLFAFLTPRAWEVLTFWRETERKRKRPWQLVFLFGLPALLKVLFGRLSLAESFAYGSGIIGVRIAALPMEDGRLAADVDQPQHLRAVEGALLRARQSEAAARRVITVFDLDRTVTRIGTYTPFLLYAAARLKPWRLVLLPVFLAAMLAYRLKLIDRDRLKGRMQAILLGAVPLAALQPVIDGFAGAIAARWLRQGALNAIERERASGALVVLATAAYDVYADAIAEGLGIEHVIATRAIVRDRRWMPGIDGRNCYGEEKRRRIEEWLNARKVRDGGSTFVTVYTDAESDRPTLALADEPVIVNPSRGFAKRARALGWPVVRW